MNPQALVLEDDKGLAETLGRVMSSMGYDVHVTHLVADARRAIRDKTPKVMLIDIDLPDGNGLDLMAELRNDARGRFIVISGAASQSAVVKSIKHQAIDVLVKPVNLNQLRDVIGRARASADNDAANTAGHPAREQLCWIEAGVSRPLSDLRTMISHLAEQSQGHAILTGELGTDKPAVASFIHSRSRRMGQLIMVNCAGEHGTAAFDRFFGVQDARTGEVSHAGYLEQASAGTLVLDDVAQLPIALQARLVTFLESGRFLRTNGLREVRAKLSVVGLVRGNVNDQISSGDLRRDFYYRLAKFSLHVPGLAQLGEDKLSVAQFLLDRIATDQGLARALSPVSVERIMQGRWHGNVLELQNALLHACQRAGDDSVIELTLPDSGDDEAAEALEVEKLVGMKFWEAEKMLLLSTLEHNKGNKEETAAMLGISLKTLYNRINAYK